MSNNKKQPKINFEQFANAVVIRGENRDFFIDFARQIYDDFVISSSIEREYVKKFIFLSWKLKRLQAIEKNLLNRQQTFTKEEVIFSTGQRRIRTLRRLRPSPELDKVTNEQERIEKRLLKILKMLKYKKSK